MSAAAVEVAVGTQAPRIVHVPSRRLSSRGVEAIECAAAAGLELDPWQQQVLVDGLRVRPGGRWAAFEVGVNVPRQNGKGGITEARELAALFAFGEPLVIHSAHLFDTSLEAFRRLLILIEEAPEFDQQVKRVLRSHGEEGLELKSGQRIRYRTRSKGGARGLTSGLLVFDEAMFLATAAHGAMIPTLSTVTTAQVWYTGSAVDREIHEHGLVFTRVRERAVAGGSRARRLAYFEFSLGKPDGSDYDSPSEVPAEVLEDPDAWAAANPALDVRIAEEAVESELESLDERSFAVERLGVGDYPDTAAVEAGPIDAEAFCDLTDVDSAALDPVVFTFDVSPEREATICAAGRRADGLIHGEVIESRPGTKWVPGRLLELVERHDVEAVVVDGYGPAASVVEQVRELGVTLEVLDSTDVAEACGAFVDLTGEQGYRHRGELLVVQALRGARAKLLGDRWAWSRRQSSGDISPLVAFTFAVARARAIPEDQGEVTIW